MPAPVIPTLTAAPPAPLRSQAPTLFTMTAETFVDWQGDFPTEMNLTIAGIEAMATYMEGLTGSSGPIISTALTMGTGALLGRTTAGDGTIEEITIGTGLSLAAGVLSATGGTYTDEMARDAIGTALVQGAGIAITVDDGADTITIALSQYILPFFFTFTPTDGETLLIHVAGGAFTIPANFTAALESHVGANPAATFDLTVALNGVTVGTISVSTGGVVTATTISGAIAVAQGDLITITSPGTADTTAANMAFTILGVR